MLPGFATASIVRERAQLVDDGHGNEEFDWSGDLDRLPIDGCSVQPGVTAEDAQHRDAALIAFTVWAPAGIDVESTDRVSLSGTPFEIDGEPERWETGILDHTKLYLKRWEG